MEAKTFWNHFEIPVKDLLTSRQHGGSQSSDALRTYTHNDGERGGSDTDIHCAIYGAFPRSIACKTKTLTETREEADQDAQDRGYETFPKTVN